MNTNTDTIQCTQCGTEVHPLAVYTGNICETCYEAHMEARMSGVTTTAAELTAMWGGR